jgi:hypothetical protein
MARPRGASVALVAAGALFSAPALAASPPKEGCRPVSKMEYTAAKSENVIISKGGRYVRTGPFWRRSYWHCPV